MNKFFPIVFPLISGIFFSQQIKFEEYDLSNGLHIILHQDNSVPIVATRVVYHVGSKDEVKGKTGFAHFFEHLLFEGSANIKRGEWFKLAASRGGASNAATVKDITFYEGTFPSNNAEFGLWMEAERMRHPVIDQVGVNTQREVVKEEKRTRIDNAPYGGIVYKTAIYPYLFEKHPYSGSMIGSMEDLDSAKLDEFYAFFKKYYVPNNATLVVAGDIQLPQTKEWIKKYYGDIPMGSVQPKNFPKEDPITKEKEVTVTDPNIQLPAFILSYRVPGYNIKDIKEVFALNMLVSYLSEGNSSVLYKKLIDQEQKAYKVDVSNTGLEDYGTLNFCIIPKNGVSKAVLQADIDAEIKKIQTTLILEKDFQKLQNKLENKLINERKDVGEIAIELASVHIFLKNTNMINETMNIYKSITREYLQNIALKYLNPNQRINIDYLPERK